jgi:predicted phage terminase large subunit-like protein
MPHRNELEKLMLERDKRESERSFYYFARFILGYDLLPIHKELCDFLQDCYEKGDDALVLWPRGTFKTSVGSQAFPTWLAAVREHNVRILLDSEVLSNSEWNLGVISGHFARNKRLRYIWGDQVDKARWNKSTIYVSSRTDEILKEPTVATASLESVEVGPHWDAIIVDDPHSEKNSNTKDQIDLVEKHLRLLYPMAQSRPPKRAPIFIFGTRWQDLDLYGRVIEGEFGTFRTFIRGAYLDNGELFCKELLPETKLTELKKKLGDLFSCQYLNDPLPSGENQAFKRESFRYRAESLCDKVFIYIDPAISEDSTACDTAIVVGGLDKENNLEIVDYMSGIWPAHQSWRNIELMINKWESKLIALGFETNAFQRLFKTEFELFMKRKNKFYRTIGVNHRQGKDQRILTLQPRYQAGAVYHKPWMKNSDLEEQLLKFPRGRRMDLIDAEAGLLEMCKPKKLPVTINMNPSGGRIMNVDERIMQAINEKVKENARIAKEGRSGPMGNCW